MEDRIKLFTISRGESVLEWYKKLHADCSFGEENVRYNDRCFFEYIERFYKDWDSKGRPERWVGAVDSIIMNEFGFILWLLFSEPSLNVFNEWEGRPVIIEDVD